jgi:peptidoglycan hydrolase-like protein with peptidoglycan-binding domain
MGATSFWTKQVAGTDYGPCRARDLNWAGTYQRPRRSPCPRYPDVTAPRHASATKVALIEFSGAEVRPGWGGPATSAIQRALNVPATGVFAAATKAAVRKFQRNHGLAASGVVNQRTWRLLLKSVH